MNAIDHISYDFYAIKRVLCFANDRLNNARESLNNASVHQENC